MATTPALPFLFLLSLAAFPASAAPLGLPVPADNSTTADPKLVRPRTVPCTVPLFTDLSFTDFSKKTFSYAPPAHCPGPWAMVVFEGDFAVTAGRQFDRTASIWVGGANIYYGTTAEPLRTLAPSWHVERELTDYSALLATPQTGRVDLGNLVNATYTGIISGSARLLFYPLTHSQEPPAAADLVLPLSADSDGGTVALAGPGSRLLRSFTLPRNIKRAWLDVYAQSQGSDEFWYTCVPDDLAAKLQSCPGTGFREAEVTIDGQPAGVAPIYPWIYTGGIDPYLWHPIPGVQTLQFTPYRVDLTPFAGVLSNGHPHDVAISVYNAQDNFATTATLLLTLDHTATQVTGAVTQNTLAASPAPVIQEAIGTDKDGTTTGTVTVRAARSYTIVGYIHTARGKIETRVQQDLHFANRQQFTISTTQYIQDLHQRTQVRTRTATLSFGQYQEVTQEHDWPLEILLSATTNADKSSQQKTTIRQAYERRDSVRHNGVPTAFQLISSVVAPTDTLLFDAAGTLTGKKDQTSSHNYFSADSRSGCYSRKVTAVAGAVTAIVDGVDCGR